MKHLFYLCILSFFVTACGGGGSSSEEPEPNDDDSGGDNSGGGSGGETGTEQRIRFMYYDFDNNGTDEGIAELFFDEDGRVERIDYEYTDDGTPDTDFQTFSLDFGSTDLTKDFEYDDEGRLIAIIDTTSSYSIETNFTWNADDLVTQLSIASYDGAGAIQTTQRFELTYGMGQLLSWEGEFEVAGGAATPLDEGMVIEDLVTGLPSLITYTSLLGGLTENSELSFTDDGQIESITTTSPDIPGYEHSVLFTYAPNTTEDILAGSFVERRSIPNDPDDGSSWLYTFDEQLLQEWLIDLDSDGSIEASITYVWEEGECESSFVWFPRAEPDFVAEGNEPYIPGTGYNRISYCDTIATTL